MRSRQIKLSNISSCQRFLFCQGSQRIPGWEDDWLHVSDSENLRRNNTLVHDNLKDKLLEPVRGHHQVSLLPPVLAPAVLHPPPDHAPRPALLLVEGGQGHGVGHQRVAVHQPVGFVHPSLNFNTKDQWIIMSSQVQESLFGNIPNNEEKIRTI